MSIKNILIICIVKLVSKFIHLLSLGSGSTWPGHIALKLNPQFVKEVSSASNCKVILIAGTNGKTTTSTLVRTVLKKKGYKVFQNSEGANLLNGIASSYIKHATFLGKIPYDFGVFEVDENTLPIVLQQIVPTAILILNLFRDQLDRYGEVNTIAIKWHESFKKLLPSVHLFLNGDDPQLYFLASDSSAETHYFGVDESVMKQKEIPHDVDSIYCPQCGEKLEYKKMSYSHLGDFKCPKCDFKRKNVVTYNPQILESSLKGVYNYYNISAAFLFLETVVKIDSKEASAYLKDFKPAFGRQEIIEYKGRKIFLLLSKNPTGFNQSIEAIKDLSNNHKHNIVVLLNDRIPDGRDISWIWDVEFQNILPAAQSVYISGDRTYDMALRFKYCLDENSKVVSEGEFEKFGNIFVNDNLESTLEDVIKKTSENEMIMVLATYSAMLETRKILVGRKLM
jgi:UDP-N-acetylmuramyl tripeptide synthase